MEEQYEQMNMEDWEIEYSDRVQVLREKATTNFSEASGKCKHLWDKKAKKTECKGRDMVLYRAPGMDIKLSES